MRTRWLRSPLTLLGCARTSLTRRRFTSPALLPYSFQGLGESGLRILDDVRRRYEIPVISEVMAIDQIPSMAAHVDVLQVGSRNMQKL